MLLITDMLMLFLAFHTTLDELACKGESLL
jgi:hypothetical protein